MGSMAGLSNISTTCLTNFLTIPHTVDQAKASLECLVEFIQGNVSKGNTMSLINNKGVELLARMMEKDTLGEDLSNVEQASRCEHSVEHESRCERSVEQASRCEASCTRYLLRKPLRPLPTAYYLLPTTHYLPPTT